MNNMIGRRVYLGDRIYAKYTGDGIELTCNLDAENSHRIFLNNDALNAFDKFKVLILKWLDEMRAKQPIQAVLKGGPECSS